MKKLSIDQKIHKSKDLSEMTAGRSSKNSFNIQSPFLLTEVGKFL